MNQKKKNRENEPKKTKRPYKKPLTEEGKKVIEMQDEVTFFDKCNNWTRANLPDNNIKLIDDTLERITPWLDKKIFMRTHIGFWVNLTMVVSVEVQGQGLLVTMKCGRKAKVTKKLKVLFRKRLSEASDV